MASAQPWCLNKSVRAQLEPGSSEAFSYSQVFLGGPLKCNKEPSHSQVFLEAHHGLQIVSEPGLLALVPTSTSARLA